MKKRVFIFIFIFFMVFVDTAFAHKPLFEGKNATFENPVVVPEHTVSYAVYGKLDGGDDVDYIRFFGKKGEVFYIQMTVPDIKSNKGFKPYVAIIGKGIYQRDEVPFKVSDDTGVIVLPPVDLKYFYEKYTRTSYFVSQTIRGELPQDGDYYIAVFSKDAGGKYTVAIGEKEEFKIADIIKFPVDYIKIKYFFNPGGTILNIAVIALLLAAIIVLVKFGRRR